jgi:glycosyltransferase involved in cell wall biosynthesis
MKKFSVITPTFNSGKVIKFYFDGLMRQNYDMDKVEILIIDGGSTDNTRDIVESYSDRLDVRIIDNPDRLPEFAKAIGINNAVGKFCIWNDSDEELVSVSSLLEREYVLENEGVSLVVLTKFINPPGYTSWSKYTSEIGDPFSSFVYGPAFSYIEKFTKIYSSIESIHSYICTVSKYQIYPLIDTLVAFDREKLLSVLNQKQLTVQDVSSVAERIIKTNNKFGVMKNNPVLHYSSATFQKIINKIHFRVVRNIYKASDAGFVQREKRMPLKYKVKKYLFLPYALLIVPALIDSIKYSYKTKNTVFMLHWIFSLYTAIIILKYMFLKILRYKYSTETYG